MDYSYINPLVGVYNHAMVAKRVSLCYSLPRKSGALLFKGSSLAYTDQRDSQDYKKVNEVLTPYEHINVEGTRVRSVTY